MCAILVNWLIFTLYFGEDSASYQGRKYLRNDVNFVEL